MVSSAAFSALFVDDALQNPSWHHVHALTAAMLEPEDARWRRGFAAKCEARAYRLSGLSIPADSWVLPALASNVTAPEIKARHQRGSVAGAALLEYVMLYGFGIVLGERKPPASFLACGYDLAHKLCGKPQSWFRNKAWPKYKPVAHMWGARFVFSVIKPDHPRSLSLPCSPDTLREFLVLSAEILGVAAKCRPSQQSAPLVDRRDALSIEPENMNEQDRLDAVQNISQYIATAYGDRRITG